MSFKALIEELDELKTLKKSVADDETVIVGDDKPEEEGDLFSKSFKMTDEDGNEVDAVDGTELVKSLTARIDKQEADFSAQAGELLQVLTEQTSLIKSLQEQVNVLADTGRGRKSVLSVIEKPDAATLTKSEQPEGISSDDFMAKAMVAQQEGKITSLDISIAEGSLNKGVAVPTDIVRKVLS